MQNNQFKATPVKESSKYLLSGYKVIEINVVDSTENLYAVVTPVKNNA